MEITITWNSIRDNRSSASASYEFAWLAEVEHNDLLNALFDITNLQDELAEFRRPTSYIKIWETIKAGLPENRPHTSLSVGDEIALNGTSYKVADFGFEKVGA